MHIYIWDEFVVSMQGPLNPFHVKTSLVTFILETVGPRPFHLLSSISMLTLNYFYVSLYIYIGGTASEKSDIRTSNQAMGKRGDGKCFAGCNQQ